MHHSGIEAVHSATRHPLRRERFGAPRWGGLGRNKAVRVGVESLAFLCVSDSAFALHLSIEE